MGGRAIGLDLAWSPRNPSGGAVTDATGRLVDLRSDLGDDAAVLAFVRAHLAEAGTAPVAIGIDMPTIVRNATGQRACERELRTAFARYDAGPHPANLARFPDGGRARHLLDALAADGVVECCALPPDAPGRIAFEVFPHPALVRLFGLDRIFRSKKKTRAWPLVLDEWARYRAALASLATAEPPLHLDDALLPERVGAARYKRWDDAIDAVTCAYVAAFVRHWGTAAPHVRVFGDLADGYVVVPDRRALGDGGRSRMERARSG